MGMEGGPQDIFTRRTLKDEEARVPEDKTYRISILSL
jgi:hypothetical protein